MAVLPDKISCSDLYDFAGGYDFEGGYYDTWQKFLPTIGYMYDIRLDAWVKLKKNAED